MGDTRITPFDDSPEQLATIAEIYADAFAEPPYREDAAANRLKFPERIRRDQRTATDFRLLVAERDGDLVGFVFGTGDGPGSWWFDQVAQRVDAHTRGDWLGGPCFSVIELAVRPGHRGKGIARSLMSAALEDLPYRTAMLGCFDEATDARGLYDRLGWTPLVEHISIAESPLISILGMRLD